MRSSWKKTFYLMITICIYLSFLGLVVADKNRQCIDSKFVDKIDIISREKSEIVLNCASPIKGKYSTVLGQILSERFIIIESVISFLTQYYPLKKNIYITIDETQPLNFELVDYHITIGTGLLTSKGHLERGIIKIWAQQFTQGKNIKNQLLSESITDLYYYSIFGQFELFDPLSQMKTKVGSAKWPQVLKNLDAYCESSWKLSEDYIKCADLNFSEAQISDRKNILTVSLRPLLSSSLMSAYSELQSVNQKLVLKTLPHVITDSDINSENVIGYLLNQNSTLNEGLTVIKIVSDQLNSKNYLNRTYFRQFMTLFNQNLVNQGVSDSFAEAYFDYLIEIPDVLSTKTEFFKSIEKAALSNLNLQIALKDSEQIWILPSKTGLSLKVFDKIKIKQHVYFACPILKSINMSEFIKTSEKLLLIKGCDTEHSLAFDLMFKFGVPDFSKKENKLSFIQFHLPSLESKINDLNHINNFFELVKNRDINQQEFKKLGWQDLQWNENYDYYKPKAAIDAIEYFRVENTSNN